MGQNDDHFIFSHTVLFCQLYKVKDKAGKIRCLCYSIEFSTACDNFHHYFRFLYSPNIAAPVQPITASYCLLTTSCRKWSIHFSHKFRLLLPAHSPAKIKLHSYSFTRAPHIVPTPVLFAVFTSFGRVVRRKSTSHKKMDTWNMVLFEEYRGFFIVCARGSGSEARKYGINIHSIDTELIMRTHINIIGDSMRKCT